MYQGGPGRDEAFHLISNVGIASHFNVLWWASILIAGGWLWLMHIFGAFMREYFERDLVVSLMPPGVLLLIGLALRYILAGGGDKAGSIKQG